jgi:hypothetical protein
MKNTTTKVGSFATAKLQANSRRLLAIALVAVIGFTVIACNKGGSSGSGGGGKLSGTYVNEEGYAYVFSGNKLSLEVDGVKVNEATFETKDGKIITKTGDGGSAELEYTLQGNTLTVNGVVFTKK